MAGLTSQGLEVKRLQDIIDSRIASARNLFGNGAGVSANDVLGRALRVHSDSERDLYELAESVYGSFNPAIATGASLSRLVAYAGLTRQEAAPSTVTLKVSGDYRVSIPSESPVDSSLTSNRFQTSEPITLNADNISGTVIEVITAQDSTEYTLTLGAATFTYTSGTGETRGEIATALQGIIDASNDFTATVEDTSRINVAFNDEFVSRNSTITANISYRKITKLVSARSEDVGDISQPKNSLDTIASPISGWDSVINPFAAAEGRLRETDEELRIRFKNSKELNARGTIDAIFANLTSLIDVESINVYENTSNITDTNGLPAKSFSVVIFGGNSLEIAQTIWQTKPAGIQAFGNTTVSIKDSQGIPHDISFSRPAAVDIYIDLTISEAEGEILPANAEEQILQALEDYFNNNYSVGDDVVYSRLYVPIQSIQGFQVDSLTLGTAAAPTGMSNVVIAFDEISNFNRANVNVTIN